MQTAEVQNPAVAGFLFSTHFPFPLLFGYKCGKIVLYTTHMEMTDMKIEIQHRYLVFPVSTFSPQIRFRFYDAGEEVYYLNIKLNPTEPTFYAYVDMERFMGKTIEIGTTPEVEIVYSEADTMDIPGLYKETFRPQVHFTTRNGWQNDPNGLVYYNGEYHMFYQHNPCESKWNNMHWNHAKSPDLIHWTEVGIALGPDKHGEAFSGSAIVDKDNLLGLKDGENDTVALYYTATSPFAQYLAYSTDGLKTIKKYDDAIVPNIVGTNRDPKVIFCDEWNTYIMVLFLENDMFGILKSDDLLNWELVQKIQFPGDYECPDLFPINADDGVRKWVMMGARSRYLVGDMTSGQFVPSQEAFSLSHSSCAYAGQTFSGLPNGRIVRMEWDKWNIMFFPINGQMSFPSELSLENHGDFYYLCTAPIFEIESLYDGTTVFENIEVKPKRQFITPLEPKPHLLKLNCDAKDAEFEITLLGVTILFNMRENLLSVGGRTMPISHVCGKVDLTLIVDKFSMELYLDGGKIYSGIVDRAVSPNYSFTKLDIYTDTDITIDKLELHPLKSIWE